YLVQFHSLLPFQTDRLHHYEGLNQRQLFYVIPHLNVVTLGHSDVDNLVLFLLSFDRWRLLKISDVLERRYAYYSLQTSLKGLLYLLSLLTFLYVLYAVLQLRSEEHTSELQSRFD